MQSARAGAYCECASDAKKICPQDVRAGWPRAKRSDETSPAVPVLTEPSALIE